MLRRPSFLHYTSPDVMNTGRGIQGLIKRLLDLMIAATAFLLLLIPMCFLALLIKLESKGPVLFKQQRIGRDKLPFTLFKFRSMREKQEGDVVLSDAERVTTIGKIIRKWRVDELPQLLNIFIGDMSFVGPRPTLPYQVERYSVDQCRRLQVKPGITGWSQIHGDEAISWPERIELDLWYIDNWSLWLDLKIILITPLALVKIRKINVDIGPPEDEISSIDGPG